MRSNLTFLGFLRQYVKELSGESTLSIKRLASCCGDFPKLRELLFLYAVFSGQLQTLRSALKAESNESLQKLCDDFGDIVTLDMLQQKNELLPERMYRVWTSYISVRDRTATENHLKEIIRKEIISFLSNKKVSVYKVCKDLEMNQGNVSRWLNHGNPGAINYCAADSTFSQFSSSDTASSVLSVLSSVFSSVSLFLLNRLPTRTRRPLLML